MSGRVDFGAGVCGGGVSFGVDSPSPFESEEEEEEEEKGGIVHTEGRRGGGREGAVVEKETSSAISFARSPHPFVSSSFFFSLWWWVAFSTSFASREATTGVAGGVDETEGEGYNTCRDFTAAEERLWRCVRPAVDHASGAVDVSGVAKEEEEEEAKGDRGRTTVGHERGAVNRGKDAAGGTNGGGGHGEERGGGGGGEVAEEDGEGGADECMVVEGESNGEAVGVDEAPLGKEGGGGPVECFRSPAALQPEGRRIFFFFSFLSWVVCLDRGANASLIGI